MAIHKYFSEDVSDLDPTKRPPKEVIFGTSWAGDQPHIYVEIDGTCAHLSPEQTTRYLQAALAMVRYFNVTEED